MTPEQLVALMGGLATLIVAVTGLYVQIAKLNQRVDGRLTELLEVTRSAAHAKGALETTEAIAGSEHHPSSPNP